MEKTFQELPNWTFWIDEISLGCYRVNGKNELFDSNLELTGEFPDEMLNEAKRIAADMDRQVREKRVPGELIRRQLFAAWRVPVSCSCMSLILRAFAPDKIFSRDREAFSRRYGAELHEPGGSGAGSSVSDLKGIDLLVRPIRHRSEDRVPAHIFLCVLAYYVEWHLRRAWASLVFEDEQRREERKSRDPILPAKPSDSVQRKKRSHQTADGLPVHSFETLLGELASLARVTYAIKPQKAEEKTNLTFQQVPEPTPVQARAYELVRMFPVTAR